MKNPAADLTFTPATADKLGTSSQPSNVLSMDIDKRAAAKATKEAKAQAKATKEAKAKAKAQGQTKAALEAKAKAAAKAKALQTQAKAQAKAQAVEAQAKVIAAAAAKAATKGKAADVAAAALVVAAVVAADDKSEQLKSAYGDLKSAVATMLAKVGDTTAQARLTLACAQLVPATDDSALRADLWQRRCKSLAVTARRLNQGEQGTAPRFGLFYMSFDRASLTATVRVIAKPTPAQIKEALGHDVKAMNAALQADKPKTPVKIVSGKDDGATGAPSGQGVTGTPKPAMAALLELVATWRPGELIAASSVLLKMAQDQNEAIAKAAAKAKADKQAKAAAAKAAKAAA